MAKFDKSMEYISQTQTLIGQQKATGRPRYGRSHRGRPDYEKGVRTKAVLENLSYGFSSSAGRFEYKQLDVLIYILEHTEAANNTFIGTYRSLEKMSA